MIAFLSVLQYLVLTLWVGAQFGFAILFAPVLFRSLDSREQAGAIAGESLRRVDSLGLATGGIMVVVTALQAIDGGWRAIDLGRLLLAAIMLALVGISVITIRQRLDAIKAKMGKPIDQIDAEDPLRVEYGRFHRLSRGVFTLNMLLGALLIGLSALR